MKLSEFKNIVTAIIVLAVVISLSSLIKADYLSALRGIVYSVIIISVSVLAKKGMANMLDANVEHEIWKWSRWGWRQSHHLKNEVPVGIVFPLLFSLLTLGKFKLMALLTYETTPLKRRAAKRFGYYSHTEMTEWHNGLVGAAGIAALLLLAMVVYMIPGTNLEYLSVLTTYYAFFSMLPVSKLDGTQIFFGSRVLWTTLAIITIIFTVYALGISFLVL